MHMIMKIIIVQISDSMIQLQKMMHMIMNIMIHDYSFIRSCDLVAENDAHDHEYHYFSFIRSHDLVAKSDANDC